MASRIMPLRFAGTCSDCGDIVAAKAKAYWDAEAKEVICLDCHAGRNSTARISTLTSADDTSIEPASDLVAPVSGEAGTSARYEYQRRHDQMQANIDRKFGRLSGLVKLLIDDPHSTTAWAKGSEGERLLAASLRKHLDGRAVLLNDRKVPRASTNIDHIVIAPSGVWIIDAKKYRGQVEYRDVGGWFKTDNRIYVGGRDQTKLVVGLHKQFVVVRKVLGETEIPIHQVLCFVDAQWKWFAQPFRHEAVWVTWPRKLAEMISVGGTMPEGDVLRVANSLAEALPSKTS